MAGSEAPPPRLGVLREGDTDHAGSESAPRRLGDMNALNAPPIQPVTALMASRAEEAIPADGWVLEEGDSVSPGEGEWAGVRTG